MTILEPRSGQRRRRLLTVLIWLLGLPGLAWAVVRLSGWQGRGVMQLTAFTPYAAAGALLVAVLTLSTRRWIAGAVAVAVAGCLAACVLPRALPDHDRGPSTGVELRVMSANLRIGGADPAAVVALVRAHDVAVLALQEFTPQARAALTAAGLDTLLPYSALAPLPSAYGSAVYSRFPVEGTGARNDGFRQAYATVRPPGAGPLLVESAHPYAPSSLAMVRLWRATLAKEPRADPAGTPRILLGDFNSTLDHAALRTLIRSGYRDAADALGKGLVGTWGPYAERPLPPVTIDHVLVDRRIGVRDLAVARVPRTDHRAVIAVLTVPLAR
jgi:endonuclease/exonuclease/phosphatase (EEP) superfamily protein YafD